MYENIVQLKSDLFIIYYSNMEKLLQLLNEFKEGKQFKFIGYDEKYWMFDTNLNADGNASLPEETIICKKFWFIERLVENDKIILQKGIIRRVEYDNYWVLEDIHRYSAYESILMYLVIQDDPISFLASILK